MKRKVAGLLALVLLAACLLWGCGGKKTYIIATDPAYAPFEYQEGDTLKGLDIELLQAVAKKGRFSYEVKVLGAAAGLQALSAGEVDAVIAGIPMTEENKARYEFADPYFDTGIVLAVARDNSAITGYNALFGKTVAVKTGTAAAAFAETVREQYGFYITAAEDSASMYDKVAKGFADACFDDYAVLSHAMYKGAALRIVSPKEQTVSLSLATAPGANPELVEKWNQGLAKIKEKGIYQQILAKYIATEVPQ